jgi:hypothetical protein
MVVSIFFVLPDKLVIASDQDIADQIQGLRDDLKRKAENDEWDANFKAKSDAELNELQRKDAQQWKEIVQKDKKAIENQKEAYIAKYKIKCEGQEIKWGLTPKEAEDSCRGIVEATRGVMETKSPLEEKLEDPNVPEEEKRALTEKLHKSTEETKAKIEESKNKMSDDALGLIDKLLTEGKITRKEHNFLRDSLLDPNLSKEDREDLMYSILSLNRLWYLGGDDAEYIKTLIAKADNMKK